MMSRMARSPGRPLSARAPVSLVAVGGRRQGIASIRAVTGGLIVSFRRLIVVLTSDQKERVSGSPHGLLRALAENAGAVLVGKKSRQLGTGGG